MFKKINEAYNQIKNSGVEIEIEEEPEDMLWDKAWQKFKQDEDRETIFTKKQKRERNYLEPLFFMYSLIRLTGSIVISSLAITAIYKKT